MLSEFLVKVASLHSGLVILLLIGVLRCF